MARTTTIELRGDRTKARRLADSHLNRLLSEFRELNGFQGLLQNQRGVVFLDDVGTPVGTIKMSTQFGIETVEVTAYEIQGEQKEERKQNDPIVEYYPAVEVYDDVLNPTTVGLLMSTAPRSWLGPFIYIPLSPGGLAYGEFSGGVFWDSCDPPVVAMRETDPLNQATYPDENRPDRVDLKFGWNDGSLHEVVPKGKFLAVINQDTTTDDNNRWAEGGGSTVAYAYAEDSNPGDAPYNEALWWPPDAGLWYMYMKRMRHATIDYAKTYTHEIEVAQYLVPDTSTYEELPAKNASYRVSGTAEFAINETNFSVGNAGLYDGSYTQCFSGFSETEKNYLLIDKPATDGIIESMDGVSFWHQDVTVQYAGSLNDSSTGNGVSPTEYGLGSVWYDTSGTQRLFRSRDYVEEFKDIFKDAAPSYPSEEDYPYQTLDAAPVSPYLIEIKIEDKVFNANNSKMTTDHFYNAQNFGDYGGFRYFQTAAGPMVLASYFEYDANDPSLHECSYIFVDYSRSRLEQELYIDLAAGTYHPTYVYAHEIPAELIPSDAVGTSLGSVRLIEWRKNL